MSEPDKPGSLKLLILAKDNKVRRKILVFLFTVQAHHNAALLTSWIRSKKSGMQLKRKAAM